MANYSSKAHYSGSLFDLERRSHCSGSSVFLEKKLGWRVFLSQAMAGFGSMWMTGIEVHAILKLLKHSALSGSFDLVGWE